MIDKLAFLNELGEDFRRLINNDPTFNNHANLYIKGEHLTIQDMLVGLCLSLAASNEEMRENIKDHLIYRTLVSAHDKPDEMDIDRSSLYPSKIDPTPHGLT